MPSFPRDAAIPPAQGYNAAMEDKAPMTGEEPADGVQGLEQSLRDLERIVVNLEKGDLPLADAIRQFERGVELTRRCQTVLKEAEQRVQVLSEGMLEDVDPRTLRKPEGENGGGGSLPL